MKFSILLFLPFLFVSCSTKSLAGIGIIGIISVFGLMLLLFGLMFYLIARRKKEGEKSLVKFNNDVYLALNRLDTYKEKSDMLNALIDRINNDEKYKKDTEWRNKVLLKTYMHLSTVYYKMGDEMQTLNICSKIIELDPTDGMAYYNRGSIYSNMGLYEKALQDLTKTIEIMSDYASAYNNLGLVREKMEHYTEALENFNRAIELDGSSIAYYNRGNTYFELERYAEALEDYLYVDKCIDNDQTNLKNEVRQSIKVTKERISNTLNK